MSKRDELIAKARKLSVEATPGPWVKGTHAPYAVFISVDGAPRHLISAPPSSAGTKADIELAAESRTLLPALADLAESEGRRADQLHRDLVHCREVECGHYIAERDMARDEVKRLDAALVKSAEYIAKIEAERDAALAELAALKGQQP